MNEEKTIRLWLDIGGINELFLDELEETANVIATKVKTRRRVKYGALVATAATVSAAIAIIMLKPKLATEFARTITGKFKIIQKAA